MKQVIAFCILVLLALNATGQSQNVDSLINILNNSRLSDKEQIDICSKITDRYILYDLQIASQYAEKGLKLAENTGDRIMASKFNAYFGRIHNTKSSYDTALVYWNKALDLAIASENKEQEAAVNVGIGVLYGRQEQNTLALDFFLEALSIYEKTGNKRRSLPILGNISSLYRAMDNYERAIFHLEKAKIIADELDDANGKMQTYYELGAVYFTLEKFDLALEYAQKAYEISCILDDLMYRGAITEVLSAIYYEHLKDFDTAWKYANECLQLAQKIDDPRMIAGAWKVISNIYRFQEQYSKCEEAAKNALMIDSTNVNITINLYENIVLSNIFLEDKAEASFFFHRYIDVIKKHVDYNNRELLAEMDAKYETEKKEMRISSLEKERQLYVWLGIAGVLLVLSLGVLLWLKARNEKKERQLVASNAVQEGEMIERERIATELHDRLLGNFSAMKLKFNSPDINAQLDGCTEEVRLIINDLMPRSLQFGIKVALEDITAQFPNVRFHFFGQEKRVEKRLEFILYCCSNELVTNSIRHSGAKIINVQLIQGENHIALTVQDDGCGFDEKTVTKGVGLKSVQDRVASCNGKMNIFSSTDKGTETAIELKI